MTMAREAIMGQQEAIRAFIVQLRRLRGFSQEEMADATGMGRRTYIAYESGETHDIKSGPLGLAFRKLRAPFEYLRELTAPSADEELGARLAAQRVEEEGALEELEMMRATMSDAEIDALLAARERELEEELNRLRGRRGGAGR